MATFQNFFRVNTDSGSTLVQSISSTTAATELFAKTIRVNEDGSALVTSAAGTNILSGPELDALIGAAGSAYIYAEVVGRGSALAATTGVKILVKNLSTEPDAADNTSYHTLVSVGDNLVLPWNVATAVADTDAFPTLDCGLTVASANASQYIDLYIAVYYNA